MKHPFATILGLAAILSVGCEKKPAVILETQPEAVEIYLGETSLGITPIELDKKDLERLNLPQYERVETSPATAWYTWDIGPQKGRIYVAHPETPEDSKMLRFELKEYGNTNIPVFGHSTSGQVVEEHRCTVITFNLAPEGLDAIIPK